MTELERRLMGLLGKLPAEDREQLLAFAEFLLQRRESTADGGVPSEPVLAPEPIAPAAGETVVGAVKRLRRSYHMLEPKHLLNETSALMSRHVVGGVPASEIIVELEAMFARHYERYRQLRATEKGE